MKAPSNFMFAFYKGQYYGKLLSKEVEYSEADEELATASPFEIRMRLVF